MLEFEIARSNGDLLRLSAIMSVERKEFDTDDPYCDSIYCTNYSRNFILLSYDCPEHGKEYRVLNKHCDECLDPDEFSKIIWDWIDRIESYED